MKERMAAAAAATKAAAEEKFAATKAAAEEKFAATKAAAAAAADEAIANLLVNGTNIAVGTLVGLFKTVQSLKTMFQIVSTIAEISKFEADQQQDAMKTRLKDLIAKLKESMAENPELQACIDTLQSKGETGDVVVSPAPPTDVGKTCVYKDGGKEYQALVVGDRFVEDNRVLDLWLNGAGIDPKTIQYDKVSSDVIFVNETDQLFSDAKTKYGQSPVTIKDARNFYEIPAPGAVAETQSSQEEEEKSIFQQLKELFTKFISLPASDKKQTLLDMISRLKSTFLDKLDRVSSRLQDPELKNCITQIKNALTAKIREQLESLKSTSSQVPGGEMGQPSGQNALPVSYNKPGLVQNVRKN
jgi:hypothetical protein